MIWFCEYPWVLTISFTFLLHTRLHTYRDGQSNQNNSQHKEIGLVDSFPNPYSRQTWLPVSTLFNWFPLVVFQKRMHLSAVPPPDARSPVWWGDQAIAFTAAVCSVNFRIGCCDCWFQTKSYVHNNNRWENFSISVNYFNNCLEVHNSWWIWVIICLPDCHYHLKQVPDHHETTLAHTPEIFGHKKHTCYASMI